MIHIATVHWQSDRWIDIQLKFFERFLTQPFRVYAFLNGIGKEHYSKFYYVNDEPIEDHDIKLNLLANLIQVQANPGDLLIFVDGDAFPIARLDSFLDQSLSKHSLIAIVRAENLSDVQPHPSFCATTVGFWKSLKGDWKKGHTWLDSKGARVSDVGGNLLLRLTQSKSHWMPLYRSHSLGDHQLWYGIYHGIIYHHGAGFRPPSSRLDIASASHLIKLLQIVESKSRSLQAIVSRFLQKLVDKQISKKQMPFHDLIFQQISADENYFLSLIKDE